MTEPLAPGAVIGILGGGQLGRMAAMAAARLGYRCHIYCPEADSPAGQVAPTATVAAYDDATALAAFAAACDVVTFEFENIPFATAALLGERVPLRPRAEILQICQNRQREKDFCTNAGIPTTRYATVGDAASLKAAVDAIGVPAVLKTTELGYDGKGQVPIAADTNLPAAWADLAGSATRLGQAAPAGILEAFVDFKLEISVIAARSLAGDCVTYAPVENRHKNHILDETIVPAPIPDPVAQQAETIARTLAADSDLVGLLAVEMFVTADDRVLVNELAPRPHNSGHWSLDACATSQFEQFIRAVAGLPLGSTEVLAPAVMKNLIGDEAGRWRDWLADPLAKLHLYGKAESRPGRKMGHVTTIRPKA